MTHELSFSGRKAPWFPGAAAVLGLLAASVPAPAQENVIEEIVVRGELRSQPGEAVDSVFGFGKSLLETPRAVSSISGEMIRRFDMRDIDELVALAPGTYTQSFFGVAGTLDIRGTPGESYFRGMRRLDNRGNYPTPIGASSRIDIVRGPASPIFGPAQMGGYMNFTPISADVEETDTQLSGTTGGVELGAGSWNKRTLSAEVGGPARLGARAFHYHLYAEVEDSGSYYRNSAGLDQKLVQASFDADAGGRVHLEFGGMLHRVGVTEVAGWNRLTQDLIDHGIYVTGSPPPLDANGDGRISHREFDVDGDGFSDLNPFAPGLAVGNRSPLSLPPRGGNVCAIGATPVFGCRPDLLALVNPGLATLDGSQVLVSPDDVINTDVITLYFDMLVEPRHGPWGWKNQLFFEAYDNVNEATYGFSQFHDSWVIENKLVADATFRPGAATVDLQWSPSLRYTSFQHGDDYSNEYFDRRDLTRLQSALDMRWLATQVDGGYTEYYEGDYLNLGLAALADISWDNGLGVLAGIRYDIIRMESRSPLDKLLLPSSNHFCLPSAPDCVVTEASDTVSGLSWNLSLSWESRNGLVPYLTASSQSTVIAGQGAEISTANVLSGGAFDRSELLEAGLKGSLFANALYFAVARFRQERTDYNAQAIATNQASRTDGFEFEMRWIPAPAWLFTASYTNLEAINLNTLANGGRYSYVGAGDIPGIAPEAFYGGALGAIVLRDGKDAARRAGLPRNVLALTGTYNFGGGVAVSAAAVDVDAVASGLSGSVTLPAYTLLNLGLVVERGPWTFNLTARNITGERYFRANFPNLYGSVIALPELPRHYRAYLEYRW